MSEAIRKIAITLGGGYVPGLAVLVRSVAAAAAERGWQVVGLRDGFDGVLFPERYGDGGRVVIDDASGTEGSLLGTGARTDPFRVQQESAEGFVEDVDASGLVLERLRAEGIDAVVGIAGGSAVTGAYALSVLWKLSRRSLPCVVIPKSVENDHAFTAQPYGYASVCAIASEWLRRVRIVARDQGRVALAELPGYLSGHLALEAGLAAGADVILTPERAYAPDVVARWLDAHQRASLVVVAEGAHTAQENLPTETGAAPSHALLYRAGRVAQQVCENVQRHCRRDIVPVVLHQLVRAGPVSPEDAVLANLYGPAAIVALADGHRAHVVAAMETGTRTVALAEAVNRVSVIRDDSPLLAKARARSVCLGDAP